MAFTDTSKPNSESYAVRHFKLNTYIGNPANTATVEENPTLNEYDIEVLTPEEKLGQLIEEIENDMSDTINSTKASGTTDSISRDESQDSNPIQYS